jgi:hypothetical protein
MLGYNCRYAHCDFMTELGEYFTSTEVSIDCTRRKGMRGAEYMASLVATPFQAIVLVMVSILTVVFLLHIHLLVHLFNTKANERAPAFLLTSFALPKHQESSHHAALAFTMFTNSGFREAPPTKNPSTSG